jgi:glycosyltransferase involved in cell wall biosynthesis
VSNPKVSVCIATYQHARFLPACLDSIINQTFQDFEIIIVNDGSTDNTHEIILEYQKRYPEKIHYSWHTGFVNKGISITTNLAMLKSCGEYISWIGSDDIWRPKKLEIQVNQLINNPHLGFSYSYAQHIDEDGEIMPGLIGTDITTDPNPLGRMIQYCHPPVMTVMFHRDRLEDIGLFDENLIYGDWDWLVRLMAHWEAGFINQPLALYRLHSHNISKGIDPKIDLQRIIDFSKAIQQKSAKVGGALLLARNQALLSLQLAFLYFCQGKIIEAHHYFVEAFEQDHSLYSDQDFMIEWLSAWKPAFYTASHANLGLWLAENLPKDMHVETRNELIKMILDHETTRSFFIRRGIELGMVQARPIGINTIFQDWPSSIPLKKDWKKSILSRVYPTLLFNSYKSGNLKKTRYYWIKTLQHDRSWIKNRGIWSMGMQVFINRSISKNNSAVNPELS